VCLFLGSPNCVAYSLPFRAMLAFPCSPWFSPADRCVFCCLKDAVCDSPPTVVPLGRSHQTPPPLRPPGAFLCAAEIAPMERNVQCPAFQPLALPVCRPARLLLTIMCNFVQRRLLLWIVIWILESAAFQLCLPADPLPLSSQSYVSLCSGGCARGG
jgi:hypothetical protein